MLNALVSARATVCVRASGEDDADAVAESECEVTVCTRARGEGEARLMMGLRARDECQDESE